MRNRVRMIVVILACAGAAACGGGRAGSASQPARGPAIPRAIATDLAARADSVAGSLDAQRGRAALDQARQLSTAVDAAIAAGRVPAALQPQLQATATRLVAGIRCTPPSSTGQAEAAGARAPSRWQTPWPRPERAGGRRLSTVPTDQGRYRLGRALGSGGMAIVYLAHDRELDPGSSPSSGSPTICPTIGRSGTRFLREAQAWRRRLSHPNVVRVYDFGHDPDGRPFIVMEYVEGGSLAEALARDGALSPARVVAVARDCCAGLAYAHATGLVHRDLKPQNLLLEADGRVKIADFGIARTLDGTSLTLTGSVLGTAGYLAPEQASGDQVTAAADIYGLGVTLHQLATGNMPGPDAPPALPDPLRGVVARCLEPDPARRPTAEALSAMLDEPATLVAPPRVPPARHVTPVRGMRNGRLAAALLAVPCAVAAIVIVAATSGGAGPPTPATHHHHARQRVGAAIPRGNTPAAQARLLARWLRQHAG